MAGHVASRQTTPPNAAPVPRSHTDRGCGAAIPGCSPLIERNSMRYQRGRTGGESFQVPSLSPTLLAIGLALRPASSPSPPPSPSLCKKIEPPPRPHGRGWLSPDNRIASLDQRNCRRFVMALQRPPRWLSCSRHHCGVDSLTDPLCRGCHPSTHFRQFGTPPFIPSPGGGQSIKQSSAADPQPPSSPPLGCPSTTTTPPPASCLLLTSRTPSRPP